MWNKSGGPPLTLHHRECFGLDLRPQRLHDVRPREPHNSRFAARCTKKTVTIVFYDTKQKLLDSHVYESAGVFWTEIKFNCLTYLIWLYFWNTCILLLIVDFLIL